MSLSSVTRPPLFSNSEVTPAWTVTAHEAIREVSVARETGLIFARDQLHWLYLLGENGERQAQRQFPQGLAASDCSDDGSAFVAGSQTGDLWWMAPDLSPRWQHRLQDRIIAVGLDALGQYVAVSTAKGSLSLFDKKGRAIWSVQLVRPLEHLRFVVEKPWIVGATDVGLVICLEWLGKTLWQDRLVSSVGGLAVSGNGEQVVLACYGDGIRQYGRNGPPGQTVSFSEPCRLLSMSYNGSLILVAGLTRRLAILDQRGKIQGEQKLDARATTLALGPFADYAIVGMQDGRILYLRWKS